MNHAMATNILYLHKYLRQDRLSCIKQMGDKIEQRKLLLLRDEVNHNLQLINKYYSSLIYGGPKLNYFQSRVINNSCYQHQNTFHHHNNSPHHHYKSLPALSVPHPASAHPGPK